MRRRLAPALAILDVVLVLGAQTLYPPGGFDASAAILFPLTTASFGVVGALLAVRVPSNRIGPMLLAAGTMLAAGVFSGAWATASLAQGGDWPGTLVAASLTNVAFVPPIILVAIGVPLLFPDGRLPSARWRIVAWGAVAGTVLAVAYAAFRPGPISDTLPIENPLALPALEPVLAVGNTLATIAVGPLLVGAAAASLVRFRRGSATERQQLKWLLAVAALVALSFSLAFAGPAGVLQDAGWVLGFASLALLPVAIAIAILRYRLYEIDRIVSRTIGWALVTGILVTVFALVVIGLQDALSPLTNSNTLAVAGSTLVAATLFAPLRRRVQGAVDRRFDRARSDRERLLAQFAERLRDEVDLGAIAADMATTVDTAVRPALATLWLRETR